jgi:hypothetical protein
MSKGWASEFDGNGEWLGIGSGEEKGRGGIPHEFLISAKTGAWMRVDDASSVAVAADRRIAVIAKRSWAWRPPRWFETTVQVVDLTKSELKARDTGIVFGEGLWEAPAVAADGSRIAIRSAANVSVYSLPDEKLLAAFPLESAGWAGVRFIDADTLEMLSSEEDVTRIVRFDIGRRARISRIELPGGRFRLDSAGSRVAVAAHRSKNGRLMTIHDTRSGSKIAELPFKSSILGRRLCWLDRGEVALATLDDSPGGADVADGEPPRVTVHAADGSERLRVPFPGARRLQIVGEQRAGQLLVVWSDSSEYKEPCSGDTRLVAIDLATGAVAELPFDGWPKAYSWRMSPVRGSVTTRLFTACDGNMVLYDVATGEKRALLGQW